MTAILWACICLPPALLLALFLHEAGHLAAAWLVGWRPRFFVVGPLVVRWEGRRIRVDWQWQSRIFGGLVMATPPESGPATGPVAILVAGGPLFTLLFGAVAGVACYASLPAQGAAFWRLFTGLFAGASLVVAMAALIPYSTSGMASDGLRLLRLRRGGPPAQRDVAILSLTSMNYAGIRPNLWPDRLLEQATALTDGTASEAAGQILAFYQTLDRGRHQLAAAHLSRSMQLIDQQPPAVRPAYYLEAAYGAAMFEGNPDRASAFLAKGQGGLAIEPYGRLRCEAAVLLAQGRSVLAMERVDLALATLAHKEKVGTDYLEEALLLDLKGRVQEGLGVLRQG